MRMNREVFGEVILGLFTHDFKHLGPAGYTGTRHSMTSNATLPCHFNLLSIFHLALFFALYAVADYLIHTSIKP
jgi:hypothetical protein